MSEYTFALVNGHEWHPFLDPLYQVHYAEMQERLQSEGIPMGPYNPQLERYFAAMDNGGMITFIVMESGTVVGYSNVWLTNDMHNRDFIAQEDVLFVTRAHRNGIGRAFTKFGLEELKRRGVKRFSVAALTDLRVAKLWKRMGFKEVATQMVYTF